jgi:hypothetical protein
MKNPIAGVCALLALTLVGRVAADEPRVVPGPDLVATGTVISVGNASMAIRTQDHGHPISFVVTTTTQMPTSVVVGSRVRISYHAVGTTGQIADAVTLLEGPPVAANEFTGASGVQPAASQPSTTADATPAPQARDGEQAGSKAEQLPATGSPLPVIGLLGLVALLASVSLRALERARS